jgi:hypothetical protein
VVTLSADHILRKERLFSESHVDRIPRRQAQALVLLAFALSDDEGAALMGIKTETFRQHSGRGRALVVPPAYELTRANGQYWASKHLAECLAREHLGFFGNSRM